MSRMPRLHGIVSDEDGAPVGNVPPLLDIVSDQGGVINVMNALPS